MASVKLRPSAPFLSGRRRTCGPVGRLKSSRISPDARAVVVLAKVISLALSACSSTSSKPSHCEKTSTCRKDEMVEFLDANVNYSIGRKTCRIKGKVVGTKREEALVVDAI